MKTINRVDENLMVQLSLLLEEAMGLHYTKERWADLEKKMVPALSELGYKNLNQGISWLVSGPLNEEIIRVLAYHLTIGETYFFRDSKRMEALENQILKEIILHNQKDKKIRIWSVACCSGEEPYSIAIMLDRLLPNSEEWDISIIGSDINREFLRKAEIGSYKKWSFRATPNEVRAKYFTEHKDGVYSIIPRIKKRVTFTYFNIMEGGDNYGGMDLILCHNVLIYFSPKQINKTIHLLANSLIDGGWLSISSIETPFVNEPHMALRNFTGAIFFKKTEKLEPVVYTPPKVVIKETESLFKVVLPEIVKPAHKKVQSQPPPKKEIDYKELYEKKLYREIISKLKAHQNDPEFIKNARDKVLILIRTYANLGELKEAMQLCQEAIKLDKLDPNLHFIHATISSAGGENQEAIKSLKKTLFIEPNFVAAHYMLGTLEQLQKNFKASKISFRTALELLEDFDSEEELCGVEELTAARAKDMIENALKRCL